MICTVDIGNSRIKWALWQAGEIVARGASGYRSGSEAAEAGESIRQVFDNLFAEMMPPQNVFAVCVAADKICSAFADWVRQHWQLEVEYLKAEKEFAGVTNIYARPEQYGADRWAGVIAAHQAFPGLPLCVIGAGTAITFDLVEKNGKHLGGFILPSYASMHAALISDAANIESGISLQYREQGIPDNTSDAVNQGLHKLIKAGVREICDLALGEMGESVQLVITGGYAEIILAYPDMPVMNHRPDLVMQGLYDIMMRRQQ